MRISILDSGLMGGKLGTLFARVGHEVVFSYPQQRRSSLHSRGMPMETRGREH
jgi:UDP-glucose 6-dehydrogenase